MVLTTLMIIITMALGKETLESGFMFALELFLTVAIVVDVIFRIKMMGLRQYFSYKWNVLEAFICICCSLTFVFLVFRKTLFE